MVRDPSLPNSNTFTAATHIYRSTTSFFNLSSIWDIVGICLYNDSLDAWRETQDGPSTACMLAKRYYGYYTFSRRDFDTSKRLNVLIHGEQIFQQLLCDTYVCVDDNVLNFNRQNQDIMI